MISFDFDDVCPSPCYEIELNEKEWHFGYSNTSKSIVSSDPNNPICDAVNICGKLIDSYHPRRIILNYFMQTLVSNSSILHDTTSYEHKALCWMMGDENDLGDIDYLVECDGTLLQFCIIGLFFSSTNYLSSLDSFSSSGHLCDISGIKCDANKKFIEELNLHDKNLIGTLNSEIGLLQRLQKIDLSANKLNGTIDDAILNLPNMEVFDITSNSFEGNTETIQKLLLRPFLKSLHISSNLFVGSLPSSIPYPSTLGRST